MSSAGTAQRAAHCTPSNTVDSIEDSTTLKPIADGSPPAVKGIEDLTFFNRRITRYKGMRIDQHLRPDGTIRRFVVLDDLRHRKLLGQPRRREIEALEFKNKSSANSIDLLLWKTSEIWELAERDAVRFLRELDKRIDELKSSEEPQRMRRPTKQVALAATLVPASQDGEVRGLLLHAGVREGGVFCIDLYDESDGCVRRVEGSDLARALEVSQAQLHEVIHVKPTGEHAVGIQEERTGTHGDGTHAITHARKTFEVVREVRAAPHLPRSYSRRQS